MEEYITEKFSGLLNLILNAPDRVKSKLAQYSNNEEIINKNIELVTIVSGESDVVKAKVENIGGSFEDLGYGYGIISIDISNLNSIAEIQEIIYFELPKTLFTDDISSNQESCVLGAWEIYKLSGKGVLVGFIDSGIDYTHPGFINEDGTSRVEFIYDIGTNKVWNNDDINTALKSQQPYEIIQSRDELGHGTHVAGIAAAGGKIDKRYYGVAYESSIAMVKMTSGREINYTKDSQIMRGIKFLVDKSRVLNMPLVINLSFSTNDGAHDGKSILEQYINTVCSHERISIVVAAGNEGDKGHHVGAALRERQTINMNIALDEGAVILQLYKNLIDNISIMIRNPAGNSTSVISIDKNYYSGTIGADEYYIYNTGATPISVNGEIIISLVAQENFLQSGIWTITIISNSKSGKQYDIWMPISEGLNDKTKFSSPNPYNTLGIPATTDNVISVGSYDYSINRISAFSGRGSLNTQRIKPDIVAPGENIMSTIPGGEFDVLSGTSMAAPMVTGVAALLMQWGIVENRDVFMYGDRLKYFLIKAAKRERLEVEYPNPLWGYGTVCARDSIELWNKEGRYRVNSRQECNSMYISSDYENYIIEYSGDIEKALLEINYACGYILDENYAVIAVEKGQLKQLLDEVKEIVYVERPALYTLNSLSPIDTANISKFHENNYLTLRGQGVLVGIVDTGIDYLNQEFIYEDDTTRIVSIWDQTINTGTVPQGFDFGSVYNSIEINNAIDENLRQGDPYSIVPSKDENGHGTSMAGIVGARGRTGVKGAAPDCEFVVVKLRENQQTDLEVDGEEINNNENPIYRNTSIVLGIKYLFSIAKRLRKPMVIFLPIGTNSGAHDGSSLVERYISDISKSRGLAVVTGSGNEADSDTHTTGNIFKQGDVETIEIKIDDFEEELEFQIWCNKPDKISLGIVSPSGEVIEKIPAKLQETEEIKFIFEGSSVFITYYIPEEITGDELIVVRIEKAKGGIWQFRLEGDYIVNGRYDIWLPQRELLKKETRFLNPSPYITLTIPSTSDDIICSATYNQDNNTLVAFSGRGFTRDGRVKPDVAAGGINVQTTGLYNQVVTVTGSSASAAVLAGAVALMLQWGIVEGNDTTMYSTKIITYLIRGTAKREGDIYPNSEWGYGMLDLNGVFKNIRGLHMDLKDNKDSVDNSKSGVYISIPKGIKYKNYL